MALPATLVWEVRPTNGTINAGGGFDPSVAGAGTDRSQQNAVQVAYTDLVIDGTTNTDITSAAVPFTSDDIGNNIAITGGTGFTAGIYNIRSIPSGNIARLDRAVGTTGSTGGTGNLGGARSGFSVGTTTLQSSLVAGNKVWVKNEAWNEAVVFTVAASAGNPITIEGYNTSRGDKPTTTGRPTNDRAGASGIAISCGGNYYILKYLNPRRAGTYGFGGGGQFLTFVHCKSDTNTNSGWLSAGAATLLFCEGSSNTGQGYYANGSSDQLFACYFHDNGGHGINTIGQYGLVDRCICESNGGHGLSINAGTFNVTVINSVFALNSGASTDGINMTTSKVIVLNCIISGNGRYGINATDGDHVQSDYNAFYNNTTAARNNVAVGPNDVTLTGDPFTNGSSGDFSLNATAGAGAACRAVGFPGVLPGGPTGYLDIGAVQHQDSGGAPASASRAWASIG